MTVHTTELWEQMLLVLEGKISLDNLQTWFHPVRCSKILENNITLIVPSKYHKDWIVTHFLDEIKLTLTELVGHPVNILLEIDPQSIRDEFPINPALLPKKNHMTEPNIPLSFIEHNLNPKYTFETFVVGTSNRLAHAAALAVADRPAKAYNPLFIYGGVGLGKTHLLHAIGHTANKKNPHNWVLYISAEQFMNAFILAVTNSRRQDFQARYRNIDILLIDDIHFLAGKEGTQEEFFHTFNALHSAHKQIVVSSDRPPKEIPTLQERLLSRFEWGLIADIQAPDLETRMAILQKKAELEKIKIPNEVIYYIAEHIQSNIRQLEGCLIRIAAAASLTGSDITMDMAERLLQNILQLKKEKKIDIAFIQQTVVDYYKVTLQELLGNRRNKGIVEPRQVAMYLCRLLTKNSFPEIGFSFGNRDHTTVMHACGKVEKNMNSDANFKRVVNHLIEQIKT